MGYHTRIALTPKQSKQAKPSTRFTPEPPRVQTQMQRTPPALPKLHPNTSIFETDLNNPHRGLFGSFGASLRHAVSHDSNSRENHTGAPDVQTKRLSYPWEHFDPSNPSAYLFGSAAPSTASHQPIQAKLAVGAVGDKYEQEADAVATQVVTQINAPERIQREQDESQMQPEVLQQKRTGEDSALQRLQRREMSEAEERQRPSEGQSVGLEGGPVSTNFEAELQGAKGHGQALDPNLQASMGQAMGADFSGVKVHTDTQSDQLNQSIQAKAFTTGQDVFFRQGEYQPKSRSGQELIAHELTHVVQQKGGGIQKPKVSKQQLSIHSSEQNLSVFDRPSQIGSKSALDDVERDEMQGSRGIRRVGAITPDNQMQSSAMIRRARWQDADLLGASADYRYGAWDSNNKQATPPTAKPSGRSTKHSTNVTWQPAKAISGATKKDAESTEGVKVEALPLGPDHAMGDEPTGNGKKRATAMSEIYKTRYVAGHLLNHHLGGPGGYEYNLVAIPAGLNTKMEKVVEGEIKDLVNTWHCWVWYEVKATHSSYQPSPKDKKRIGDEYVSELELSWGAYKGGKVQGKENKVKYHTISPPNKVSKPTYKEDQSQNKVNDVDIRDASEQEDFQPGDRVLHGDSSEYKQGLTNWQQSDFQLFGPPLTPERFSNAIKNTHQAINLPAPVLPKQDLDKYGTQLKIINENKRKNGNVRADAQEYEKEFSRQMKQASSIPENKKASEQLVAYAEDKNKMLPSDQGDKEIHDLLNEVRSLTLKLGGDLNSSGLSNMRETIRAKIKTLLDRDLDVAEKFIKAYK
jgi:hypothetical protein